MEREVRGGIGMGNTCKPMAVSFQCMTKFTTNKKKRKKEMHLEMADFGMRKDNNTIINMFHKVNTV